MTKARVLGAVGVVLVAAGVHDADACICVRSARFVVRLNRVEDAPLNARVRIELVEGSFDRRRGERFHLRAHDGAEVPTSVLGPLPPTGLSVIELRPVVDLTPSTRYEVALLRPGLRPSTFVVASFVTGTSKDVTPPELEPLGNVEVGGLPPPPPPPGQPHVIVRSSCGGDTPHVMIDAVKARDPQRPGAQLAYGVWLGDGKGKVDVTQAPTGIFFASPEGHLTIGASDSCMMDFPFPSAPHAWLGIAALDEAGNASKPRMLRVALR